MMLDRSSGRVQSVLIVKSAGAHELDQSALNALKDWLFLPWKWNFVDVPITFGFDPGKLKFDSRHRNGISRTWNIGN